MHPLFKTTTTFFEADEKQVLAEGQKKTLKKFWIEEKSFTTFEPPKKLEGGREYDLRVSRKKFEKRFGLNEKLFYFCRPLEIRKTR